MPYLYDEAGNEYYVEPEPSSFGNGLAQGVGEVVGASVAAAALTHIVRRRERKEQKRLEELERASLSRQRRMDQEAAIRLQLAQISLAKERHPGAWGDVIADLQAKRIRSRPARRVSAAVLTLLWVAWVAMWIVEPWGMGLKLTPMNITMVVFLSLVGAVFLVFPARILWDDRVPDSRVLEVLLKKRPDIDLAP